MAHPVAEASEDSVTGVAGVALWGEMLDHLGLVGEADRRNLRPIGPGGYTGGECRHPDRLHGVGEPIWWARSAPPSGPGRAPSA